MNLLNSKCARHDHNRGLMAVEWLTKQLIMMLFHVPEFTTPLTRGTFGTLNVDYIRNSNLYYWEYKTL